MLISYVNVKLIQVDSSLQVVNLRVFLVNYNELQNE